jgi:TonB family protein
MQGLTTRREAGASRVDAAYVNDRSRMFCALVFLLVALAVLLAKDREFWFGDAETTVADQTSIEWVPGSVVQPAATPAVRAKKPARGARAQGSAEPVVERQPVIAATGSDAPPAVIPPFEVEVIAGDTRGTVHLGSNPVKVVTPSKSEASVSTAAERGLATVRAEPLQMSLAKVQTPPQPPDSSYPLLGRQMKVQGSVLLQAFISANGVIRDLRVLSGPAILASAAREAARRWQFRPYLQDGQPVETQAKITVNFTIKVLNNGVRDQTDTVVALSTRGE